MVRRPALLVPLCFGLLVGCSKPKADAPAKQDQSATDAPSKGSTKKGPEAKAEPAPTPSGDCTPVLNTLITKQPQAELSLKVGGQDRPLEFKVDAVYPANPLWDASDAPSLCAAVLQPPQVERPALNLVGQFEAEGKPVIRLQAEGLEMGERDLGAEGPGSLTAALLEGEEAKSVTFTSGKLVLERVQGAKSRVTVRLVGATGSMRPAGDTVVLDGSISATVGGR